MRVLTAALDREQKESRMRDAIAQGATTADLLDLTPRLSRFGLE